MTKWRHRFPGREAVETAGARERRDGSRLFYLNRLPGRQFITAPAGGAAGGEGGLGGLGLAEADAAGFKAKGGRKQLWQEVGGAPLTWKWL